MAPQVGFEPTTRRLTADRSTTELLRNNGLMIAFTPLLLQGIGYLEGVIQAKVFYALKSQNLFYVSYSNLLILGRPTIVVTPIIVKILPLIKIAPGAPNTPAIAPIPM